MQLPIELRNKKFLIVDDYQSMRMIMIDHLQQLGVSSIKEASSGNEAYQFMLDNPGQVEFVLSDMMMDNGSGIEFLKKVRAHSNLKHIPFVLVTSKSDVALVVECVKAGVSGYVVKPWKIEDLCKKMLEAFKKANG